MGWISKILSLIPLLVEAIKKLKEIFKKPAIEEKKK